ncbi:hypothetical protein Hypma_000657 [Hypsizygus marmoreus]|uniref:Uncharacterized protein n=1 Tax=Hypsizygus marmoreus TaxID=39966 RepID=A0A369JEH4_HYPMA|nr:hypothetical protein Hypma_000657 [Hypsizygus marmoreus]
MNRPVTAPVNLPVGPEPGWELDNNEDDGALKSIPERFSDTLPRPGHPLIQTGRTSDTKTMKKATKSIIPSFTAATHSDRSTQTLALVGFVQYLARRVIANQWPVVAYLVPPCTLPLHTGQKGEIPSQETES